MTPDTATDPRFDQTAPDGQCWPWEGGRTGAGYGAVRVNGTSTGAHRVAWELKYGTLPLKAMVLHSCDNPLCVNPAHLRIGTRSENACDARDRGKPGIQRLDWDDVRQIRAGGSSDAEAAARYGLTRGHIVRIRAGRYWRKGRA